LKNSCAFKSSPSASRASPILSLTALTRSATASALSFWERACSALETAAVEAADAIPAVKGIEEKMWDAERALNAARAAVSRAEQALSQNESADAVADLVRAVKDKMGEALDAEGELLKAQEFFNVLDQETQRLQTSRDAEFAEELE
jgi:hypothetical protein